MSRETSGANQDDVWERLADWTVYVDIHIKSASAGLDNHNAVIQSPPASAPWDRCEERGGDPEMEMGAGWDAT
jgi:hypothetical protein